MSVIELGAIAVPDTRGKAAEGFLSTDLLEASYKEATKLLPGDGSSITLRVGRVSDG